MEWVLTSGKTVEEAREKALDQLGVGDDEAEIEILEEPKPGLFGRVRGEARIRARVRPSVPRPKVERRERRRRTPAGPKSREATVSKPDNEGPSDAPAVVAASSEPAGEVDEGARAAEFLSGLAGAFGLESATEIIEVEDGVEVRLQGDDLGVLIGPRGQTLTAVQDLTRLVAQQQGSERRGRLRIDIGGYREKRSEALRRFTEQVAAQVVESGTPRILEPMSSADRKVVHDTAATIAGVQTISEGEDPQRRVVIQPADA
jgi:spoIIIJ-associated protein